MKPLTTVRTKTALRAQVQAWRCAGETIALVPTMGALHAGHLSLVHRAKTRASRVVASLFVNPTQFAPHEDFEAYPRDEARDAVLLAEAGLDLLYAPSPEEIYPPEFSTTVVVGGVSSGMEGAVRPSHFAGVATVVSKLLIQCAPDFAVFGEKDYQQLQVIRKLAGDLDLPVEIIGSAIVRDRDGLALSSRNAYLTRAERGIAPALYQTLIKAAAALAKGAHVADIEAASILSLTQAGFESVDYFEVRDPESLTRKGPGPLDRPARILATARLGKTRLLDNIEVRSPGPQVA